MLSEHTPIGAYDLPHKVVIVACEIECKSGIFVQCPQSACRNDLEQAIAGLVIQPRQIRVKHFGGDTTRGNCIDEDVSTGDLCTDCAGEAGPFPSPKLNATGL